MKVKIIKNVFYPILAIVVLSGCATTKVRMDYRSSKYEVLENASIILVDEVNDHRKHDQRWLGAIRGGYGNPLKTLKTPKPVKDVVKDTFIDALKNRGLLASGDRIKYYLNVDVNQFDCNQYVRMEAHVKLSVKLIDAQNNNVVFSDFSSVDNVEGSVFSLKTGIFASTEALRKLAEKTLTQAIDEILNKRAFRDAVKKSLNKSLNMDG